MVLPFNPLLLLTITQAQRKLLKLVTRSHCYSLLLRAFVMHVIILYDTSMMEHVEVSNRPVTIESLLDLR